MKCRELIPDQSIITYNNRINTRHFQLTGESNRTINSVVEDAVQSLYQRSTALGRNVTKKVHTVAYITPPASWWLNWQAEHEG